MRVLVCTPLLYMGGTEMHAVNLVRSLRSLSNDLRVCCYYEHAPSMVAALEDAGAKITMLGMQRSGGLPALFLRLCTVFRECRPDVVHVQYIAPGLIPILSARASGVRTVFATVHQPGDRFGRREKLLLRTAARLCTAFFCVSRAVEESWFGDSALFDLHAGRTDRKHFTIYNGVVTREDVELSRTGTDELRRDLRLGDRRVIGIVARLSKEKGHEFLFDALPIVAEAVPDVMVLVIGNGPERETLLQRARRLGINGRIVWMGERPSDETQRLYGVMDVVAVPSVFEGFGLAAAEAMAAGRPVVATRIGGLKEIVDDKRTGHLVDPGDTQSLAGALIEVLKHPADATNMGSRARAHVARCFSSDRFSRATLEAYRHFSGARDVGRKN